MVKLNSSQISILRESSNIHIPMQIVVEQKIKQIKESIGKVLTISFKVEAF